MVYGELYIILGAVLTLDQVKKILSIEEDEDDIDDLIRNGTLDSTVGGHTVRIFTPGCCSESQLFIVGFIVRTYYRKYVRCDECRDDHWVCNNCIGTTSNGYYDVASIAGSKSPLQVNIRNVCLSCFDDNKRDMGGHLTHMETATRANGIPCQTCNLSDRNYWRTPDELLMSDIGGLLQKEIDKCFPTVPSEQEEKSSKPTVALYYKLNDCLSCT